MDCDKAPETKSEHCSNHETGGSYALWEVSASTVSVTSPGTATAFGSIAGVRARRRHRANGIADDVPATGMVAPPGRNQPPAAMLEMREAWRSDRASICPLTGHSANDPDADRPLLTSPSAI